MAEAKAATISPVEERSDRRTWSLLAVASVMLVGLIYAMVARDQPVSCPDELLGAWETKATGYEDGMLMFTKTGVSFSVGVEHLDAQAMRRIEMNAEGLRTLYTIVYGSSRNDEQTLVFYYHTKDQTITFKNQAHLVWTRKTVES
jgi:hypothetical protein